MRKAFSLVLAIVIMITIATLMALMLSLSTSTAKQTADIYAKEQAQILAKSATEFAMLAISGHNNSLNCINKIDMTFENYEINISLMYIGSNLSSNCKLLDNNISTSESNGTIIVDTYVTFNNENEPIRYHRRTIQKP